MKVRVHGHGVLNFPDTMTEGEVKAILKQFEPQKDDTVPKLLTAIEKLLKNQKPIITKETQVQEIEKQVIVKEPQIIEIDRPVQMAPKSWHFSIERNEDGAITDIYAEPYDND